MLFTCLLIFHKPMSHMILPFVIIYCLFLCRISISIFFKQSEKALGKKTNKSPLLAAPERPIPNILQIIPYFSFSFPNFMSRFDSGISPCFLFTNFQGIVIIAHHAAEGTTTSIIRVSDYQGVFFCIFPKLPGYIHNCLPSCSKHFSNTQKFPFQP